MEYLKDKTVNEMRNDAVMKTFFDTLKNLRKENPRITQAEVLQKAVKEKAPRFFITFENARRLISRMVRKQSLPRINKNKLEMYKEIYHRYMKQCKGKTGSYRILENIIEEPAPSFYLNACSFRRIIYGSNKHHATIIPANA